MVENTHQAFPLTPHKGTHDQAVNHASVLSTPLFEAPNALGDYQPPIRVPGNNHFFVLVVNEVLELMADDFSIFKVRRDRRLSASAGQRRSNARIAILGQGITDEVPS